MYYALCTVYYALCSIYYDIGMLWRNIFWRKSRALFLSTYDNAHIIMHCLRIIQFIDDVNPCYYLLLGFSVIIISFILWKPEWWMLCSVFNRTWNLLCTAFRFNAYHCVASKKYIKNVCVNTNWLNQHYILYWHVEKRL